MSIYIAAEGQREGELMDREIAVQCCYKIYLGLFSELSAVAYVYIGISFMNCFSFSKSVLVCPKGLAYPQEIRKDAVVELVAYA